MQKVTFEHSALRLAPGTDKEDDHMVEAACLSKGMDDTWKQVLPDFLPPRPLPPWSYTVIVLQINLETDTPPRMQYVGFWNGLFRIWYCIIIMPTQ